jgi:predicted O-methyltransferase YrrM
MFMSDLMINTKHLRMSREDGWGYLPATDQVMEIFYGIRDLYDPRSIIEIGFNAGHSTTYMLEIFKDALVHSIGPSPKLDAEKTLLSIYPNRFMFYHGKTEEIQKTINPLFTYQMAFIDGLHDVEHVKMDLDFVINDLKCKWILMDNCERNDVQKGISYFEDQLGYGQKFFYNNFWKGKHSELEMRFFSVSPNNI